MLKKGFGAGGIIARTLPEHSSADTLIPSSIQDRNEKWMAFALLEAMNGVGWSSPNPSVGCVVVKDEKIIARGFTQAYGGKHAERIAFESLAKSIDLEKECGLHVFVTLEPCSHTGKQPPCVDLLLHSSVEKVFIGTADPFPLVSGNGIQRLKDAGKEVVVGVLKNEVDAWHLPFLNFHTRKKPLWVAKWAQNQDGLLADADGNSKWITNSESRAYTHWLRQKYDAILVGAGTWLKDHPQLTVRDCAEPHRRNPVILIHDPKNSLPAVTGALVFKNPNIAELVEAVEKTNFGFELQSVFCEGGAHTLNELFKIDRVDVVHRFIGQKELAASKHKIAGFNPETNSSAWAPCSSFYFGNDLLQEWVKCS